MTEWIKIKEININSAIHNDNIEKIIKILKARKSQFIITAVTPEQANDFENIFNKLIIYAKSLKEDIV